MTRRGRSASTRRAPRASTARTGDLLDDVKRATSATIADVKHAVIADALGVVLGVLVVAWASGD